MTKGISRDDPALFVQEVFRRLKRRFGPAKCPLHYKHPHELCIAVILSARCTDEQVNRVTPELFRAFPTVKAFALAPLQQIENLIHSTGFFRNKARSIQGFCRSLLDDHGGTVPAEMEALLAMPGVGRKTANVILQELYRLPSGIVVDTHVARLSRILGLTKSKNPLQIEKDLQKAVPRSRWVDWSLYIIFLGRSECTARKRMCAKCVLSDICPTSSERDRTPH